MRSCGLMQKNAHGGVVALLLVENALQLWRDAIPYLLLFD
eukprot:COSAG03_NODE_25508_length_265_cov_0.620482_1_plen_39_part_10